jgi:hypothetical protein
MKKELRAPSQNKNLLKRILIYGLMTLFLASLQTAFFPILSFCPKTPDLIMGMLLAITLLDDEKSAAVCALGAGFFVDAIGSSGLAISPVVYIIFVLVINIFARKVLKSFVSYLLLLIPALIFRALATYLLVLITELSFPKGWVFTEIILPEMLATALLCLPIYFIVKLFSRTLETHGRFTF